MAIPKDHLIGGNLVREFIDAVQFQPAGVDLTLSKVFRYSSAGRVDFDNRERKLSDTEEVEYDEGEYVFLPKGSYKVRYNEVVSVPEDAVAFVYPRSSLLRCGASIETAVWDPGYEGRGESLLTVQNEHGIYLKKNSRIVQMVFFRTSGRPAEKYSGKYMGENI